MKKQLLLVLSLLLLPVFANAQGIVPMGWSLDHRQTDKNVENNAFFKAGQAHYDDPLFQDLRAFGHRVDAAVRAAVKKKIDRFLGSDWAQGMQRLAEAYDKVSSEADSRREERKNPRFSIQDIPVPARGTLGRFIYDKTETALERFTQNHVWVYSWLAKLHFEIELPDTPKVEIHNYAKKRAYIATSNLLKDLRSNPFFEIHPAVTDEPSRGALAYQKCILEAGGLDAEEKKCRDLFGEDKIQEFENILEVREKWVYYMEKNPIFQYYVLTRDFSALQSLSKAEYETLLAFFSGAEPTEGWQYRTSGPVLSLVPADGYLIRCSGTEDGTGATNEYVNPIYVKISDQLVVEIIPEILDIDIYRVDADYQRSLNWKNSKDLQSMWDFVNSFSLNVTKSLGVH